MRTFNSLVISALLMIFVAGCASMSQPNRPAYSGLDGVGMVNGNMLVGTWNGRILNPIEGEQGMEFTIEYRGDGTATSNSKMKDISGGMMGAMEFEVTGTWKVDGDKIIQEAQEVREVSGNKLGGMVASMMGGMKKNMTGTANVYEASADRIVFVADEGQAQELTRVK